ncbi:MAG TPA: hypothetical protein VNL16_19395 [Chloroflexota bacterium]|nr:hypothetical protein [Chloroflexota bacterium]
MIVDSHAHTFPDQSTAPGFARSAEFFRQLQHGLARHGQPTRRVRDNAIVDGPPLWSATDPSPNGFVDVNFRAGRFGRFLWTVDGVDYYKQYLPAWLDPIAASAELIVAMMDHAGVDRCVLQNDSYYGKLNDFFGDCVRRYPERFIGTIYVDETRAHTESGLRELHRGATRLGLRGPVAGHRTLARRGNLARPAHERKQRQAVDRAHDRPEDLIGSRARPLRVIGVDGGQIGLRRVGQDDPHAFAASSLSSFSSSKSAGTMLLALNRATTSARLDSRPARA